MKLRNFLPCSFQSRVKWLPTAVAVVLQAHQALPQGYVDVAAQQGITFITPQPIEYFDLGTGISFYDFNGDGWDDVSFGDRFGQLRFFQNNNGTLEPLPSIASVTSATKSILWGDVDNDGDPDLLTTAYQGTVRLFRNDGDWNFTDVTAIAGFIPGAGKFSGASFADYDHDGSLDLYVCNYIPAPEPYAYAKTNHLYHNNGNGTFTDVTVDAGVGNGMLASFQSVWEDVDQDGWADLFLINDFAGANALYHNERNGTFSEIAASMGLGEAPEHCMSISFNDFDLDGDRDLFMTNSGIFPLVNNARHMLEVNNGDGTFSEMSNALGLDIFDWGWGSLWVDHDNDGYQDLFVATKVNDYTPMPPTDDLFFTNQGGTAFVPAPELFNGPLLSDSYSVARGDLDSDGYSEILVSGQSPFPAKLWKNVGGDAHYVRIGLQGTISNRQAIGSRLRVFAGGKEYMHYTLCGENYLGQSSQYVPFGLGQTTTLDSVIVHYPSGHIDHYYDMPVDTLYRFTEGETFAPAISTPNGTVACEPDTIMLDAGDGSIYEWSNGATTRSIPVTSSGSYHVVVTTEFGIIAESEAVEVVVGPLPVIIASIEDPACAGELSGSISLENLTAIPTQEVNWSPIGSGEQLNGISAGSYTYSYSDMNGCATTGTVELMDPDGLFVLAMPSAEVEGDDGSFVWTIFGGTAPYGTTINGEPVEGLSVGDLSAGAYLLEVTDASGCAFSTTVTVAGPVGLIEPERDPIHVYPNPVQNILHVDTDLAVKSWSITDSKGATVMKGNTIPRGQLAVDRLVPGAYFIGIRSVDGNQIRKPFVRVD